MGVDGANRQLGFWVDLQGTQFDEPDSWTWLQALPLGKYKHPLYGEIDITPDKISRMVSNFQSGVREQELDIDYDHKAQDGRAAGWVKSAEARLAGDSSDGLWIAVEWTSEAKAKLQDRQYRYFSSDYADEWEHPKTGQKHQDVLFGGAITNRPYLKDILPINLSEVIEMPEGGMRMNRATLEKLARKLGVPFTAETTDEELTALLSQVDDSETGPEPESEPESPPTEEPSPPEETPASPESATPEPILASEAIKLSDGSIVTATELVKRLETMEAATRLSEARVRLSQLDEGAKFALSPVSKKQLSEILVSTPKQLSDKVYTLVKTILKDGVIELGERDKGSDPTSRTGADTASRQFSDLVDAEMKGDANLSYVDATMRVGEMHPDLWEGYRREAFLEPGGPR